MADILSQDELDALLSQMKDSDEEQKSPNTVDSPSSAAETELELSQGNLNVDMILNLPVKVCAELGRARVSVAEILGFCQGTVVELDNVGTLSI